MDMLPFTQIFSLLPYLVTTHYYITPLILHWYNTLFWVGQRAAHSVSCIHSCGLSLLRLNPWLCWLCLLVAFCCWPRCQSPMTAWGLLFIGACLPFWPWCWSFAWCCYCCQAATSRSCFCRSLLLVGRLGLFQILSTNVSTAHCWEDFIWNNYSSSLGAVWARPTSTKVKTRLTKVKTRLNKSEN